MIDYKKEFEIEKLSISEPVKNNNRWIMHLKYDDSQICFQTPSLKLNKTDGILSFNASKKHPFFKFIDCFEDVVVKYLHSNSEKLFKGKVFSVEKLKNSLETSWEVSDDGLVSFKYEDNVNDLTHFLSPLNEEISYNDLSSNVTCIIFLESVIFSKDKFNIKYFVSHMKSRKFTIEEKNYFENNTIVKDDNLDFFNE